MTIIEKTLEETKVLHGWDGLDVLPNVEEDPNDIWLLVKYSDHGDHFLVVGTKDGKFYEYGLYVNRERTFLGRYFDGLRKPKLYKTIKDPEASDLSNKIYWEFDYAFRERRGDFGYNKKYYSESYAQLVFDREMKFIQDISDTSDVFFDYEEKKRDIRKWLELNHISTEENIRKLDETRFNNKVGEYKVIGEAGKIEKGEYIHADYINLIIVNNKTIDPDKVTSYGGSDEWGYDSVDLSLRGFRPSKK